MGESGYFLPLVKDVEQKFLFTNMLNFYLSILEEWYVCKDCFLKMLGLLTIRERKARIDNMSLSISSTGLELIKKYEGCRLTAYKDCAGVWTIGYGHTSGVKKGQIITRTQADIYLKSDCLAAENAVNSYNSTYKWNQNQFDALVSFTFNCGSGNLKKLLDSGKRTISQISAKITAYDKADGKVLQGLVNRRAEEKKLFDTEASNIPSYKPGSVYTLQVDKVNVRKNAGTGYGKVAYANLTANAKENAYLTGQLKKGTKITCKAVQKVNADIWIKIPSGWIAGYYNGKVYVK